MGIFSGLFRSRDKPKDSYDSPSYSYFFGRTHAGKRVNDRTAMQIIAVYACVRVLSEAIAQLPLHVYQYTDNGKERVPKHPLYFLMHDQPNPEMTSFVFRETLMAHLLIYGNAYAQIIRNGRGDVIGLYPLMPDKVRVDRDDHGRLIYRYSRYDEHNPNFRQQGEIILPMEQVLHIPGLGFDGLVGYSPIAMAKNAIGLAVACDEYGASFFANGASPSAVLEHPGVIKNPERVREAWQRAYGSGNAHKTAILEEGMKYTPISIPNNEAQFLETRKFQIEEIARLYRVPLHMIGDLDHATFSNIEHLSLEFVKYTLDPWLVRWEQGLQKALLSDSEKGRYFIKFNVEGLLRGDYASRMQGYATARQKTYDAMEATIVNLGKEIQRMERQAEIEADMAKATSAPILTTPAAQNTEPEKTGTASAAYSDAFWNSIRNRNWIDVRNDLHVGTDTEGGFLVPDEFERKLIEALEEENIFRQMATVIKTSSGDRKIPIVTSKGDAVWMDEEEQYTLSDDTFGQASLSAYKLGTAIKISEELLGDSVFDLPSYIAREFARRIGAKEEEGYEGHRRQRS